MRLAIHFARLGPYHVARIDAAQNALKESGWSVLAIETAGTDRTYAWEKEHGRQSWKRCTIFPNETWESIPPRRVKQGVADSLNQLQPDAVAISGWGSPDARACLAWCKRHGAKAIVMSETRKADGKRVWWKERIKKRLVSQFDAGLVGARSHRDYLVQLGLPAERIQLGYNVVDNEYFAKAAEHFRGADAGLNVRPYFLASNRSIDRKNLTRLIQSFSASYQHCPIKEVVWNLCLLGDGPLTPNLQEECNRLGLEMVAVAPWESKHANRTTPTVFFPGFRQKEELPRFYAHAGCFVHPALEEPWGLVINEAMACGLPILSSINVGAAEELVDVGVNGWTFEPTDTAQIAILISRVSTLPDKHLQEMGQASQQILEERCQTSAFGKGLLSAVSS